MIDHTDLMTYHINVIDNHINVITDHISMIMDHTGMILYHTCVVHKVANTIVDHTSVIEIAWNQEFSTLEC